MVVNYCGKTMLVLIALHLCAMCFLSNSFTVTQSQDQEVVEGETVKISCCWTDKLTRWRSIWLKNNTPFKDNSSGSTRDSCFNLTIPNTRREDSGTYSCHVSQEIPTLKHADGTGTVVKVKARSSSGKKDFNLYFVIIPLSAMVPLLLIPISFYCCQQKNQALVTHEIPHISSDLTDADKHSTSSSRGSSQWCQVVVYNSLDYFERAESKGSR